jgi:diguanylate cyclase (GGDEF)-like protein
MLGTMALVAGLVLALGVVGVRLSLLGRESKELRALLGQAQVGVQIRSGRIEQLEEDLEAARSDLSESNAARLEMQAELVRRTTLDPLTNLPNHAELVSVLDAEIERARRQGTETTLLILDLDHFKWLNESLRHQGGDAILTRFSAVVLGVVRGVDVLGRWGGEEFVAILPDTGADVGSLAAERVRASVAGHVFAVGACHRLSCSIGLATFPGDADNRGDLVDKACRAMQAAKKLGRNQIRTHRDPALVALQMGYDHDPTFDDSILVSTVEALAAVVQVRDQYTGEHTDAMAALAVRLALALGLDTAAARLVGLTARVLEIGKVAIPDALLQKPARLTDDEWKIMRTHPEVGAAVVSRVPPLRDLAPAIRSHHERWDGRGYPQGLSGITIPLAARIAAVADAYFAMTTERSYRSATSSDVALTELRRCAGTQFDPAVVQALDDLLTSAPSVALDRQAV